MECLATSLVVPDIKTKIVALKEYIKGANKYGNYTKSFLPLVKEKGLLPISKTKYSGKVAYINWITRGKTMYLNLNICYNARGNLSCFEILTKNLVIKKVFDINKVRTLDGKRFKRCTELKRGESIVYSVDTRSIYCDKPIKLLENGLENFASRDKILQKFGIQSY
jgi:hypothetical protein